MPLYTCPGCQKPIAESQPLDHCLGCEAMYATTSFLITIPVIITVTRNQRQALRRRYRSVSMSEGTEVVECTIITIILRRPSQQYGPGSATPPPSYDDDQQMAFPWEPECTQTQTESRAGREGGTSVDRLVTTTRAIDIRRN